MLLLHETLSRKLPVLSRVQVLANLIYILKIIVLTLVRLNLQCILAIMSSEGNWKRKNKGKEKKGNREEKSGICIMGICTAFLSAGFVNHRPDELTSATVHR